MKTDSGSRERQGFPGRGATIGKDLEARVLGYLEQSVPIKECGKSESWYVGLWIPCQGIWKFRDSYQHCDHLQVRHWVQVLTPPLVSYMHLERPPDFSTVRWISVNNSTFSQGCFENEVRQCTSLTAAHDWHDDGCHDHGHHHCHQHCVCCDHYSLGQW